MAEANTAQIVQPMAGWTAPGPFMSQAVDQIAGALADAQGEFEIVAKTESNPFFKSKYADLPSVVKAATPILANHGLAVWQGIGHDTDGDLLWTVVLHKSGQFIGSAMRMRPVKNDPQAQGSAVTYARRYSYMAALGLVADEDDDGNRGSGKDDPPRRQQRQRSTPASSQPAKPPEHVRPEEITDDSGPVSEATLDQIRAAYKDAGINQARMKEVIAETGASVRKVSELTQDQGNGVLLRLRRIAAANRGEAGEDD